MGGDDIIREGGSEGGGGRRDFEVWLLSSIFFKNIEFYGIPEIFHSSNQRIIDLSGSERKVRWITKRFKKKNWAKHFLLIIAQRKSVRYLLRAQFIWWNVVPDHDWRVTLPWAISYRAPIWKQEAIWILTLEAGCQQSYRSLSCQRLPGGVPEGFIEWKVRVERREGGKGASFASLLSVGFQVHSIVGSVIKKWV